MKLLAYAAAGSANEIVKRFSNPGTPANEDIPSPYGDGSATKEMLKLLINGAEATVRHPEGRSL